MRTREEFYTKEKACRNLEVGRSSSGKNGDTEQDVAAQAGKRQMVEWSHVKGCDLGKQAFEILKGF